MPQIKNGPASLNQLLEDVYNNCMKKRHNETVCAQSAWSAAKGAGWYRGKDGKWHRKSISIDEMILDIEKRESTVTQSVLLSKKRFKTKKEAIAWLKRNSRKYSNIDSTTNYWRARQRAPGDFREGTFVTHEITNGVKLILGKLKKDFDKKILKLNKKWQEKLIKLQETGMGYQNIIIQLKSGTKIKGIVLNGEILEYYGDIFSDDDIVNIILQEKTKMDKQRIEKAVWTTAYINDLPDSAFAYVETGEKDKDGKTVPRTKRHLPYKDKNGNIDPDHVRNALQRLPQTSISEEAKKSARKKLINAARKVGIKTSNIKKWFVTCDICNKRIEYNIEKELLLDALECPECHAIINQEGESWRFIEKAKWTRRYINDLHDSAFAYVEAGGKDKDGKTVPRSKRHLPYKDKNGNVDPDHVRNALARLPLTQISVQAKAGARMKLVAAAKKVGIDASKK